MTDSTSGVDRLGDKDLPFKMCESCGGRGELYVVDGDVLCADCVPEVEK